MIDCLADLIVFVSALIVSVVIDMELLRPRITNKWLRAVASGSLTCILVVVVVLWMER